MVGARSGKRDVIYPTYTAMLGLCIDPVLSSAGSPEIQYCRKGE